MQEEIPDNLENPLFPVETGTFLKNTGGICCGVGKNDRKESQSSGFIGFTR